MIAPSASPYRGGLAAGVGVMLLAGLLLAVADVAHTGLAGGVVFVPVLLGVWALIALPAGLALGVVLGAGNASWGDGWLRAGFRRLREDGALDRAVAAGLIAAAVLAGVLALAVNALTLRLVVASQRQSSGALLLGVAVVGLVPMIAVAALPLFRVTRWIAAVIPALGPLSRSVLLVIGAALATVAAGAFVVVRKYDYQAVNLGALIAPALIPVLALAIALLGWGPVAGLRERIPRRGALVLIGAVVAAALPLTLAAEPSRATQDAILERSYFGGPLVRKLRTSIDGDGDGESAFFGGPDCNDADPDIYSGATEVPGNGIDDNCLGGDGKLAPAPATAGSGARTGSGAPAATALRGGNGVVVIFIDTLRHDRLGIAGYRRDGKSLTPRLDALAAQSVVFERAFAQAPNTPRSVPSMWTSHYPSQVKYDKRFKDYPTVLPANDTLFEAMKAGGFTTIGQSSHFYFCDRKANPGSCANVVSWMNSSITQGADVWDNDGAENIPESNRDVAGPRVVKKAIAKLDELARQSAKFAMLIHLFEPHSTYVEHPGFVYNERQSPLPQRYDYEVAFVDNLVGELLDALDTNGLSETTTVVVVSDHGEAFGVHTFAGQRMWFHGQTLYRELIHVPLMFRVPGAAARKTGDVVQLIDVAPTIVALFGLTAPASWQGRSLVPALEGKPLPPMPAFSELLPAPDWDHDAKSMISGDGSRHLFYRISDRRWELYDLAADPDEKTNLFDRDPAARQLQEQLTAWIEGPLAAGRVD